LKDEDALDYDSKFLRGVQFVCCDEVVKQLVWNSAVLCCARWRKEDSTAQVTHKRISGSFGEKTWTIEHLLNFVLLKRLVCIWTYCFRNI